MSCATEAIKESAADASKRWELEQKSIDRGADELDAQAHLSSALSVGVGGDSQKKPLPDLPSVASFEFSLLPESLQPWVEDITNRIQCPADYIAVAVMAGLGSVIGRKVGIRPQERTDWTEYSNQWALTIGRPGVLKSPSKQTRASL